MNRDYETIQFYLERGKWDEALAQIQNLLATRSEDSDLWRLRAEVLRQMDRLDEALESAKRAIELDPEAAAPFNTLAHVLLAKRRYAEGLQAVDEAIERDPQAAQNFVLKAALFAEQKQWSEALAAAQRAVELDPEDEHALNLKSYALDRLGRTDEAEAELNKALKLNPQGQGTYTLKGWTALTRGQPDEALENFREALRLDPTDDAARAGIAEAMRNRNLLYRIIYKYYDFMSRFTASYQWVFIIGYLMAQRGLRGVAKANPAIAPYVMPVSLLLIVFAFSTWLARPLMNMTLYFDRYGYHALTRRDIYGAFLTTGLTLFALALTPFALLKADWLLLPAGGVIVACISSTIFVATGWRRAVLALVTAILFVSQPGIVFLYKEAAPAVGLPVPAALGSVIAFWGIAAFGSMFLANWLIMSERE